MANTKNKFKFFILILTLFLSIFSMPAQFNNTCAQADELDEIYEKLEEAPFDYIFGIDPYQADEYTKYIYSPYPLFRSGVTLIFKSKTIPPGYYLLTPREKDGKTYILFKENGKISYVVPVYRTDKIHEGYYEEKFPHAQMSLTKKTGNKFMDFIGKKWGHRNKRTPIPQAYIEFNDAGVYWDMILYYGEKKYYLIFKKD